MDCGSEPTAQVMEARWATWAQAEIEGQLFWVNDCIWCGPVKTGFRCFD